MKRMYYSLAITEISKTFKSTKALNSEAKKKIIYMYIHTHICKNININVIYKIEVWNIKSYCCHS